MFQSVKTHDNRQFGINWQTAKNPDDVMKTARDPY